MPKIFLPPCNEYREIDQIVSFGCSMTRGDELLDQLRFPEIPDIEAWKKELGSGYNWSIWERENWKLSIDQEGPICRLEEQLAWPAQFAKLYNIPLYNYAQGASSFEKQISQFMLAKSQGKITSSTLVLWGFTAKERGPWFQLDKWSDWTLGASRFQIPDDKFASTDVSHFWVNRVNSDIMLLWKYYMCLYTAFSLANEYCNDQFLFVQALNVHLDYNIMEKVERQNVSRPEFIIQMKEWFKIIDPKYQKYRIFDDAEKHVLYNWTEKFVDGKLGGGHPSLESHQRYAQLIVEELDKKSKK